MTSTRDSLVKWQAIKTAPTEGRERVLAIAEWGTGYICMIAYFVEEAGLWKEATYNSYIKTPTHWMPLPKPPEGGL